MLNQLAAGSAISMGMGRLRFAAFVKENISQCRRWGRVNSGVCQGRECGACGPYIKYHEPKYSSLTAKAKEPLEQELGADARQKSYNQGLTTVILKKEVERKPHKKVH